MPDLRAHGESAAPHDPAAYPSDILVQDARALMAHLNLSDFDIGGFSLGARTVAQLLVEGLQPRRAILAGMGLEGLRSEEHTSEPQSLMRISHAVFCSTKKNSPP